MKQKIICYNQCNKVRMRWCLDLMRIQNFLVAFHLFFYFYFILNVNKRDKKKSYDKNPNE